MMPSVQECQTGNSQKEIELGSNRESDQLNIVWGLGKSYMCMCIHMYANGMIIIVCTIVG